MTSLFDDLAARLDPTLIQHSAHRDDLGALLFNTRDKLQALWVAAERTSRENPANLELLAAVEALRPVFGQRAASAA